MIVIYDKKGLTPLLTLAADTLQGADYALPRPILFNVICQELI